MKIIAHRANLNGPNPEKENQIESILACINRGFDVEIDLWYFEDDFYLGHDQADYEIDIAFLLRYSNKLWCHCKNLAAFEKLLNYSEINCFWHQKDDYILTSRKNIWVYPGKKVPENGIVVMPEWDSEKYEKKYIGGICTDYPMEVDKFLVK